jgi:hypothetical protein
MKPVYYEILWDVVCFLNVLALTVNSYVTNRQGRDIEKLKIQANGGTTGGPTHA